MTFESRCRRLRLLSCSHRPFERQRRRFGRRREAQEMAVPHVRHPDGPRGRKEFIKLVIGSNIGKEKEDGKAPQIE
jgi:hypothetical protein